MKTYWCALILLSLLPQTLPAQSLRAGAGETDITPTTFPIATSGNFLTQSATFADGTLHARAIALDDGRKQLIIATADSLMIPRELADRIKCRAERLTGIPAAQILVSATHSHSAPPVMGALGTDEDPQYSMFFEDRFVEAIAAAVKHLEPARIGWAVAQAPDHTHNRSWITRPDRIKVDPFGDATIRANMHPGYQNPDFVGPTGPTDPGLTVISIQTTAGKPLAVLTNYSMHYIGGSKGVSADYFGYYCQRLRELNGGAANFVAIQTQGTSGDQHYMDYSQPAKPVDMQTYANELAAIAYAAQKDILYRDTITLDSRQTRLTLNRRYPNRQRLDWAANILSRTQSPIPRTQKEVYAREQMYIAATPTRELILQVFRIGDLAITAIPNEVYAISGLKLKAQSPLPTTMNIELANGAEGYIPPPEQHKLGGYTTWPARTAGLEVEAEPRIVETLLGLLEQVAGKPRRRPSETRGAYPLSILASRPLAYWRASEFQGSIADDATGNGNNAVIEDGVALYLDGPTSPAFSGPDINRAFHLAGGHLRATLPRLGPAYTVDLWFHNGMPLAARAITGYLFSRGADRIGITQNGNLFYAAEAKPVEGPTTIPLRTWQHLTLARTEKEVRVYLNGKLEISVEDPASAPSPEILIGGTPEGIATFEGKLDEIALWPRPLQPDEIAARSALATK
ncbi:MAG: LamG domain-containing protein [Bryobacteraceae bacterium]